MKLTSITAALAACACMASANAATMSYTGNFTKDNDVVLIDFSVAALQTVQIRTWSYAGGVNGAGQTIARGGFDPIIQLFNAAGVQVGQQDDAECPKVAADAVTRQCWDINYSIKLGPGNYTVSLQQYNNYSVSTSLADGFYYAGAQNASFRGGFIDEMDNKRTGLWALDIVNASPVQPASVPEPSSALLMGAALAGMSVLRRRR
jgi:hypothetical protein